MKKKVRLLSIFFLILGSSFLTYQLVVFIGKTFFFNRLFYQKSPQYGYVKDANYLKNKNFFVQQRVNDLSKLISQNQKNTSQMFNKDDNQYIIVIIGDSMAYGTGVKTEDNFPSVLEKKLNSLRPTKVYNLSLPGDDIVDHYIKYQLTQKNIQADLYIIPIVDNDLVFVDQRPLYYPDKRKIQQILESACVQAKFDLHWENMAWEKQVEKYYFPSFSYNFLNHCVLDQILVSIDKNKTIFTSFTPINDIVSCPGEKSDLYAKDNYVMFDYKKTIENFGGYFVNVLDHMDEYHYTAVSQFEGHPSKETHYDLANILFHEIIKNKKWHFIL